MTQDLETPDRRDRPAEPLARREPREALALDQRGLLDLRQDRSRHRRFAALYDDMLT